MALFNAKELQQISDTVAEVEKNTAGEVVVAVVGEAGDYRFYRLVSAILMALGAVGAYSLWCPVFSGLSSLVALALVIPLLFIMLNQSFLRFIPPERGEKAAQDAALKCFAERGVYRTRDQSGVLIFIAEAERQVVVLGDEGIDRVIADDAWTVYVDRLRGALKEDRGHAELLAVLRDVGAILAEKFPPRADDTNELSDDVVVE